MSIRALRTLVTVVEVGSFQRAAERLHLTLSAVSMQMRQLEADFAISLFDRAYRPPRLTGEGMVLAEAAREIVGRYDDLPAVARGAGLTPLVGSVALGVTSTVSVRLLPGCLARLTRDHPRARVTVETGLSELLVAKVAAGQLDAAVVTGTPASSRRVAVDVIREEALVLVAPAALVTSDRKAGGPALAQGLLRDQPYIRFQPDIGIGKLVQHHLEREGIAPKIALTLDGVEAIIECVALGVGVTVLPEPDARRYGAERVACLQLADPPLVRQLVLVTRPRAATHVLRRALLEVFAAADGAASA